MKRTFLLLMIFALLFAANAQTVQSPRCPSGNPLMVSQPGQILMDDFTITDSDGVTHNLYQTLAEGKTVFIDLFYTTCGYCQLYAPIIEEIYQNTGAGQGQIVFWGISDRNTNAQINAYKTQHGVTNPCAGTEGGGLQAHNKVIAGQNFQGWPTYVVVCPDGTVYFDPCYPPTVTGFDPSFEACAATVLTAAFSADTTALCGQGTVHFTDETVGDISSWSWTFQGGDPATSTEQNPAVLYSIPGTYDVSLTVTSGSNTNTESKTGFVNMYALPEVTLAGLPQLCYYDLPHTLTEGVPAGGVYQGEGVYEGTFYPDSTGIGTFTITYTYSDENGCTNSAQSQILVDECTGIAETQVVATVYPNPSQDGIFHFTNNGNSVVREYSVANALGKVVLEQKNVNKSTFSFSFSGNPKGVYFLKYLLDGKPQTVKLLIK